MSPTTSIKSVSSPRSQHDPTTSPSPNTTCRTRARSKPEKREEAVPEERDNPGGVPVPPPFIYLGILLLGLALHARSPQPFLPDRAARLIGWPLLGGGVLLAGWFSRTMRLAETPFRLDEPATTLITHGPFRYSRNPGYLAFAMIYAGIACLVNAFWAAVLLPATLAVMRHRVIEREEGHLEREFGDEYRRYKARVRCWI